MTPTPRFSATPLPQVNDTTPAMARICLDGRPTALTLRGEVLAAAFARVDGFLLFLGDDVPWEEGLNVHLLDAALVCRDSVFMGWPYTPGMFSGLQVRSPDVVEFCFPGETQWRLTVLPAPRLALPLPDWMPGVARPATWRRWLELTRLGD
jgi:hypothetical protein